MNDKSLLSVTEVAAIMELGRSQILRLCNQHRLYGAQKIGNTWVIPRSSVEAYEPGPQGFAAVWGRRKVERAALREEIEVAISVAKGEEG
ncbi:helix-turn-helix domain-containing protein [Fretibacterium fastidiosum]|uniref:helix-turn-helix domain-containing protein n=1 Tax=Fretibacterium fastidiosum TaxID=651822 RepID=UPI001AD7E784|nr:helix-turn-helix domain-containing protein [Fretibacterium fastidiosum]